jgi:hypothetical protein
VVLGDEKATFCMFYVHWLISTRIYTREKWGEGERGKKVSIQGLIGTLWQQN